MGVNLIGLQGLRDLKLFFVASQMVLRCEANWLRTLVPRPLGVYTEGLCEKRVILLASSWTWRPHSQYTDLKAVLFSNLADCGQVSQASEVNFNSS